MKNPIQTLFRGTISLFVLAALIAATTPAQAQDFEEIGGPYEADDSTVVLMHFNNEDNLVENSADAFEVPAAQVFGESDDDLPPLTYLEDSVPGSSGLNGNVFIDNNQDIDSSYIAIPDNGDSPLDLSGSWTIEMWVNVFTFTPSPGTRNFAPRLFNKEGLDGAGGPNYYSLFRANGDFGVGFGTGSSIIANASPTGVGASNSWYHVTFIRDAESQVIAQLVHTPDTDADADTNPDLIYFGTTSFDTEDVALNDGPLLIGAFPPIAAGYLDGAIDEFRVSNVVRNFRAPPIVSDVTDLPNQTADSTAPYPVEASVSTIGDVPVGDVTLHYDIASEGQDDSTEFQTVNMTSSGGSSYTAEIPQQEVGTTVRYYISAESGGATITMPQPTGEDDGDIFYQFAVTQPPETNAPPTLNLTFEEGDVGSVPQTGDIEDESYMDHRVEVTGTPSYTDDAAVGDRAIQFAPEDSAFLEIDSSPAVASNEYLLDFWFKADSINTGARLVLKENSSLEDGPVFFINYKVFNFGSDQSLRGAFFEQSGGLNGGNLDPGVVQDTGVWYHAQLYASEDEAIFQFIGPDGNVTSANYSGENLPALETSGPLYIGFSPIEPGSDYFYGKIDDVKFYNYPRNPGTTRLSEVTRLAGTQSPDDAPYQIEADVSLASGSSLSEASVFYDVTPPGEVPSGEPPFDNTADLTDQGGGTYTASLPSQDAGSVVRYYVVIEDDQGTRLTVPSGVEGGTATAYQFGVGMEEGQMLNLTFEEGSGSNAPANQGLYELPIMFEGLQDTPSYSSDAAPGGGSQSLQYAADDTSWVSIDSPFLTSEEFLIDFWVKPEGDPIAPNTFLVTKEGGAGLTSISQPNQINYKVFTCCGGGDNSLRGASLEKFGQLNGPLLDPGEPTLAGEWQRVVYYMEEGGAYFAILTQNDDGSYNVVGESGYGATGGNEGELPAQRTLGDFLMGWTSEGVPASPLNGKLDNVQFYNYAQEPPQPVLDAISADTAIVDVDREDVAEAPSEYQLEANYPNPFRQHSTIEYSLPEPGHVTLEVYDLLGRRVRTLASGERREAGTHTLRWNGEGGGGAPLASGVYFVRLTAGDVTRSEKVVRVQ